MYGAHHIILLVQVLMRIRECLLLMQTITIFALSDFSLWMLSGFKVFVRWLEMSSL